MVEVYVARLGHDGQQRAFVVVLQENDGERVLPIWIGRPEAESIAAHLHGVPCERPMTHDLVRSLLAALEGAIERVVVTRVVDHTYYAEMHIARGEQTHVVDARPSDAIAIALRVGARIFAEEGLLEEFGQMVEGEEPAPDESVEQSSDAAIAESASDAESLRKYLEQLKPEDFGRFSL